MQVSSLLQELLAQASQVPVPASSLIHIENMAGDLAQRWPQVLGGGQQEALEFLCRKIHVARRVDAVYTQDWTVVAPAVRLSCAGLALLTVVFLAYGSLGAQQPLRERGIFLKYINAAWALLEDHGSAMEASANASLRLLAEQLTVVLSTP